MSDDSPKFTTLGKEQTATHLLTHGNWNSSPWFSSHGSNETGVRRIENGEVVPDSFELIQHGWHDCQKAGAVIKALLGKGRSTSRIADIMDYIKDRRWVNQPPKAKVSVIKETLPREEECTQYSRKEME